MVLLHESSLSSYLLHHLMVKSVLLKKQAKFAYSGGPRRFFFFLGM